VVESVPHLPRTGPATNQDVAVLHGTVAPAGYRTAAQDHAVALTVGDVVAAPDITVP
jgi:hypothetical protein